MVEQIKHMSYYIDNNHGGTNQMYRATLLIVTMAEQILYMRYFLDNNHGTNHIHE